jgi:tetratricopeptide (TPR) repeat protein
MKFKADSIQRDPFAMTMIWVGLALMSLPLLVGLCAAVIFGWPLSLALLPRDRQPVPAAGEFETLLVIAHFTGGNGVSTARDLDKRLVDQLDTSYLYNTRTGLVSQPVSSEGEARDLGDRLQASFVMWGDASPGGQIELLFLREIEPGAPDRVLITVPDNIDQSVLADWTRLLVGLLAYQSYDLNQSQIAFDALAGLSRDAGIDPAALAYFRAGTAYRSARPADAIDILEEALEEAPGDPHLNALYAQALLDQGAVDETLAAINAAVESSPDSDALLLVRAGLLARLARFEEAIADYESILARDPDQLDALHGLVGVYTSLGEIDQATAALDQIIALSDPDYPLLIQRAELQAEGGDITAALEDFEAALEVAAGDSWPDGALSQVLYARGIVLLEAGLYQEAEADLAEVIRLNPADSRYVAAYGMVFWAQGESDQARGIWETNVSYFSSGVTAVDYNNLAWELALQGYYEPALDYSNRSLALDSTEPNSLHTHGYANLGLGNYEAALLDFDLALNHGLFYSEINRDIADALLGAGRYEEAVAYYERYFAENPYAYDRAEVTLRLTEARIAAEAE